ncbi:MAG TPA: aromatic amino acid lyase, partial [Gammaproteobacteria bacterium]|nr:aromatic amino acid lyase [Gammaproteobacteria bacterium]
MKQFVLHPGELSFKDIVQLRQEQISIVLSDNAKARVAQSQKVVSDILNGSLNVYGVNTGFGQLASKVIDHKDLKELQKNLLFSHAAGVGPLLSDTVVKLILLLKINCL